MRSPLAHPWPRVVPAACFGAFAIFNIYNARHKGGDFDVFLDAGRRMLDGADLYDASGPGVGIIGPPFHALFFAPLAWLDASSGAVAELAWYALNLAALAGGAVLWVRALSPCLPSLPQRIRDIWRSPDVLLPLLAIGFSAQANFEHQNMNPILLCLLGGAALALAKGQNGWAGAFVGVATALKAFPGLAILYLALRGRWRAAMFAACWAAICTVAAAIRYGRAAGIDLIGDWIALQSIGDWPTRVQNQSLYASIQRLPGVDDGETGWWIAGASALLLLLGWVAWRLRSSPNDTLGAELALATATAVLLSPIAWDHYWVLMFPAFLLVLGLARQEHGTLFGRAAAWLFVIAAVLTSGLSRATLGRHGLTIARELGNSTIAALLLTACVAAWLARRARTPG